MGRIFDDRGNRMSPTHARRRGVKYRYYLSSAILSGQAERAGSMRRVPATVIEKLIVRSVRDHLKLNDPVDDRQLIDTHVVKVEVQPAQLVIHLAQTEQYKRAANKDVLRVSWQKPPSKRRREILLTGPIAPQNPRPIRSETRATLVASIARGRHWLNELISDPAATTESIAEREGCSVRKINMTISLTFLAPDLVKAAIEGRLPHGMGLRRLCDLPVEWTRQHQALGLASQ